MTETTDKSKAESLFEPAEEQTDETPTVRERIRRVVMSLSEPAKVSSVAAMADCSAVAARTVLREYAEMGLIVRADDSPEAYEPNPAYIQFLQGHRVAVEHSTEQLRAKLVEAYHDHRSFAAQFGTGKPAAVSVDERESPDRAEALSEWEALLSEADDLREAYYQREGRMPAAVETLPTPASSTAAGRESDSLEELLSLDPIYFPALSTDELREMATVAEQHRELVGAIRDQLPHPSDSAGEMQHADTGE
ncbi:MAG: hypothetical protein ABEH80_02000 [Halobaculum sp.]